MIARQLCIRYNIINPEYLESILVNSFPSASSGITQGAAPSSWRVFCAPSTYHVWYRQCTPLAPGSAPAVPNLPAPPGDMYHIRRSLANALLAWAAMRLPPPPETLGWSDPANCIYGTFASFDYVSSTTRAILNALTVFFNALTVRRMLSWHGEFSHATANAPANTPPNATSNAPMNSHANAHPSAPASAPRLFTNAHRAEAFVIPTQGEATLTVPLCIDTPSSKDRKAPVPQ
jgi:hypothetical protein